MPGKAQRVMTQPITLIYRYLQTQVRVEIWLYENPALRFEGVIIGFDEYMNLTLDRTVEVAVKSGKRRELGRILLKGDNITVLRAIS